MVRSVRLMRHGYAPGVGLGLLLLAAAHPVAGQSQQQLEALRNLSPDLQQQLLEQVRQETVEPSFPAPLTMPTAVPKTDAAAAGTGAAPDLVPRLRAGDSLLLTVTLRDGEDRARSEYQRRILNGNPYRLDRTGHLLLPGPLSIALAGLTASQAGLRLNADPRLQSMEFHVQLLPIEAGLKPFGYDLFTTVPTTFAPATDIPVPAEYVIGPGDTIQLQLIGERGGRHLLIVSRDGVVDLPELGPVEVAGLNFEAARALLERRVAEQMIGMRASISMGALRSIQMFVLGEAERPGSYTVSGLSTMTNALFTSGGVRPIGSLRQIQLKRNGEVIRRLDLYDLLLNGDTSNDVRLMPGDVIFIPPVGTTVAVTGEIRRPAIYELNDDDPAAALLYLAGGLTPEADPRVVQIERIDDSRNRTVINLDLSTPQGRSVRLQSGDSMRIGAIRESVEGAVSLVGHVHRSRSVQYRPGMHLTDLVGSLSELKPLADLQYVLVRRESGPTRRISVVSADLTAAFGAPGSAADLALQSRDTAYVFDLASSRDRVIAPIIEELRRQSGGAEFLQVVGVSGRVKVPGQYPLEPGMKISDLLRASGGLDESAYVGEAELTRYRNIDGERRESELVAIKLADMLAGLGGADLSLQPFDHVVVKEMPQWGEQETIRIVGEVRFPGEYPIHRGENLASVIRRAGGLTGLAFREGSVFTRYDLKVREQRQLEVLAERMQRDLATLSLQQAQSGESGATQAVAAGQALLADLKATEAVGRLVIDLDKALAAAPGSPGDLIVKGGDQLVVPRLTQEITVVGEVQNATSHFYDAGLTRDDYIMLSGGATQRADRRHTFIIQANGSVAAGSSSRWFGRGAPRDIRPGDTIVVPLDADRLRPLATWTSVTQILYNIAVAVAAVNSF